MRQLAVQVIALVGTQVLVPAVEQDFQCLIGKYAGADRRYRLYSSLATEVEESIFWDSANLATLAKIVQLLWWWVVLALLLAALIAALIIFTAPTAHARDADEAPGGDDPGAGSGRAELRRRFQRRLRDLPSASRRHRTRFRTS